MKKTKKALASLAIAGMVLSMAPASVFAADDFVRLAGSDRYQTSIKIAEKAYASADTAVVAAGNPNNLVDALAAAPLAAQEDAPIYLTDKADMNDDVVKSMKALGVKKVVVVGAAASKAVVDELKAAGFAVDEVKGADRIATAKAINAKLTAPEGTFVVGYDGVADAMSVASYAAANNFAIVVANQSGTVDAGVKADYIVGGTTRVKDIAGAKRLAGADRYDTNKQVIAELDFDFGTVYVGNGLSLADALVGSVLAAQTDSPIALTDGKTVKADIASNLEKDSVLVALGGTAAVSNAVMDAVKNPPSTGEFKVESITASAANAVKVKFSKAPADTAKINFEVKQGQSSSAVAVNVTWNEAKTEAVLSKSSNFVSGTYTVGVKEDTKELASKEVTYTEQKVAKIEITSTKLGVVTSTVNNQQVQTGYATYKILDQYGVDITNSALANNVDFKTGVGTIEARKGLIKLAASNNLNLLSFAGGIVITANDMTSGVSTTATLAATSQIGTLSDITLNKLVSADGTEKELTAASLTDVFYVDYTATDISGNATNNFELVKEGLILSGQDKDEITTSNPDVTVKVVQDPKDSNKAMIELRTTDKTITVDTPVIITAMTWTGKTSQLNLTLKKQAEVAKITLLAPNEAVASNESATIPFVAYDQNGKEVTKFADLKPYVQLNTDAAYWDEQIDGTAVIKTVKKENKTSNPIPQVITATVSRTGHYSTLTINIQKAAVADALALDTTVLKPLMQSAQMTTNGSIDVPNGAVQKIDFGYDAGGLAVKDQYGRDIDMTTADADNVAKNYYVKAEIANKDIVTVVNVNDDKQLENSTANPDATVDANGNYTDGSYIAKPGENQIVLRAKKPGTVTVRFALYGKDMKVNADGSKEDLLIDTKSQTMTVVADSDIKGYTIDSVPNAIYAANNVIDTTANTARVEAFAANPKIYGTTASGAKVVLKGTPIIGATVNSPYFTVIKGENGGVGYKGVKVVGSKLPDTMTEASATLSVTVKGVDGAIKSVSTDVKSSKVAPVAKDIVFVAPTELPGVTLDGDTLTIDTSKGTTLATLFGTTGTAPVKTLAKYDNDGKATTSKIHFYAVDQYGKKGMKLSQVLVTANDDGVVTNPRNDGSFDSASGTGSFKVSAVVGGLVKTIKIVVR